MPIARFEMPDGRIARFEVPEGTTPEQAQSMMQNYDFGEAQAQPEAKQREAKDYGIGRTAFDQGMQGATFGLADEVSDRLGAGIASLYTGEKYSDLLKEARGNTSQRLADQMTTRPALSIGSNIAGGVFTGVASAGTKAGAAVANSLRTGSLPVRIGKGVLAGAASGGAYGAGAAEDGKRLEGAARGAATGAALGGVIPAAGAAAKSVGSGTKIMARGVTARAPEALDDAVGAMKEKASQAYKAMREAGAVINRPRAVNISNKVEQAIAADGKLNATLHGSTLSVLKDFKDAARQGDFTLEELDQWRQLFRQVAGNFNDPINQRKASIAIEAIDDAVEGLKAIDIRGGKQEAVDALLKGRAEWSRASKFERIAEIVKKSDGDANYLKRELKKLADNPKKVAGFTAAEREALKEASSLTAGEGLMKMLGKFGFDLGNSRIGSGVGALVGSGVGGIATGGAGAVVVPTVGTAARYGQKAMARGKAENLLRAIEGVAPANAVTKVPPSGSGVIPAMLGGAAAVEGSTARRGAADSVHIRGDEIGPTPTPQAARQYMIDNFKGKSYINRDSGHEVNIGTSGIKKATSGGTSPLKASSLARVNEIIENGKYLGNTPDSKGRAGIESVHYYMTNASVGNKPQFVRVVVRQIGGKKYFYDQVLQDESELPADMARNLISVEKLGYRDRAGTNQEQPQGGTSPASNVQDSSGNVGDSGTKVKFEPMSYEGTAPVGEEFLDKVSQAESSGNPNARNPNSTASGEFQFTNGTWAASVSKFGRELGITMRDKNDPEAQRRMAYALAVDNARYMQKALPQVTRGDVYVAHFLGAPGAVKLIRSLGTGRDAATLFPRKVVNSNRSIFFDGRRPRRVEEVYALLNSKVS